MPLPLSVVMPLPFADVKQLPLSVVMPLSFAVVMQLSLSVVMLLLFAVVNRVLDPSRPPGITVNPLLVYQLQWIALGTGKVCTVRNKRFILVLAGYNGREKRELS